MKNKKDEEKAKEVEILVKFLSSKVYNLLIEYLAETDKGKKKELKKKLDEEIERYNSKCLKEYAITIDYWDNLLRCYRNLKWDG